MPPRRGTSREPSGLERIHTRLGELSLEADRLSTPDDHTPESPERDAAWRAVAEEWQSLAAQADGLDETIAARFAEAGARVRQREEDKRAAAERTLKQQVQRVDQLIERVTARAAAEDLTLREADRAVRDLKSAMDAPPPVSAREQHALAERLKAALAVVAPRLHDLREMDEWKRFANAAVQEELIAKAEALRTKYSLEASTEVMPDGSTAIKEVKPEDIEKAARELHEIQERWKQVAEAPRAQAQALWHRYRQAADPIQTKAREFFAQRAEERTANLQLKMALIERAEALAESTDWIKTADELKKLQAEWQQVGAGPASGHEGHLEALPRRVRPLLHPPQRRPHRAQGNLVGEPREEGRALRQRRGARRLPRVGQGGGRDPPAAGRMEDHRPGAPHQVRGDLAAFPHGLRHVLRTLQAPG